MDKARFFIHNHLLKDVEDKSLFYDAKTILQEMVQAGPDSRLQYVLTREAGPDHAKEFTVETRIGGKTYAIGKGKTKKGAERHVLLLLSFIRVHRWVISRWFSLSRSYRLPSSGAGCSRPSASAVT